MKGNSEVPVFRIRLKKLADKYPNQTAFADSIGMSQQLVNYWLSGKRDPNAKSLMVLSLRLGVSVDWLLGISDVMQRNETVKQAAIRTNSWRNSMQ